MTLERATHSGLTLAKADRTGFKMAVGASETNYWGCVADLLGSGSNRLTETLKEWNDILQHSSLVRRPAQNTNERKDESASRDSRPAVGRRRSIA